MVFLALFLLLYELSLVTVSSHSKLFFVYLFVLFCFLYFLSVCMGGWGRGLLLGCLLADLACLACFVFSLRCSFS